MGIYPRTAAERAMTLQEVLLRVTSGKIKWWQEAKLIYAINTPLDGYTEDEHGRFG